MIKQSSSALESLVDEAPELPLDYDPHRRVSVVHCFEFLARQYAYFVRTGDLVRLSPAAFQALSSLDRGVALSEIGRELEARFGAELAAGTLAEIEQLVERGYLEKESELGREGVDHDLQQLLQHQPRNIMFLVTEACNLACTYCYELNQGVHSRARTLKMVDARKTIDAYFAGSPDRRGWTVTFFGGEPLLNFRVVRETTEYALARAAELGKEVDFTLTTNLTLLTEEIAEFMARHKFHVMVSIDGDREGHDRYRKTVDGQGTYDTVTTNLRVLIEKMKKHKTRLPKIRATLTAENNDSAAVERHLRSLGTHLVMVGGATGTAQDGRKDFSVGGREGLKPATVGRKVEGSILAVLEALERDPDADPAFESGLVSSIQKVHTEITMKRAHSHARPILCGVCRNMKAVTPTGDIYPCHRYVGMEAFHLGNVHRGGADPVKVRAYYEGLYANFEKKCAKCYARHLCGGQCPWTLATESGRARAPKDEDCDLIRASFERALGLYAYLLESHPRAFERITRTDAAKVAGLGLPDHAPDDICGR